MALITQDELKAYMNEAYEAGRSDATGVHQGTIDHHQIMLAANAELITEASNQLSAAQRRAEQAEAGRALAETERDNLGESLRRETRYRVLAEQRAEDAEAKLAELRGSEYP